jgi:hypothetical protein
MTDPIVFANPVIIAGISVVIARSHPGDAGEKREKDEKKRSVNMHIIFFVIANAVKQSRYRPCSPDGCQTAAYAWIASSFLLAMTSLYTLSLRTK